MPKTILVIDDDTIIRTLAARVLESAGFTTLVAHNGPSGVELFRTGHPDLVVLDIAMPGMNGFETVSAIRALEQTEQRPHTPIVLLTAYVRAFLTPSTNQVGFDSYLTKPVTSDKLVSHVNRFFIKPPAAAPAL